VHYQGRKVLDEFVKVKDNEISINRTDIVTDESNTKLFVTLKFKTPCAGKVQFRPATIY
jgi:alpha-L-fucosidase